MCKVYEVVAHREDDSENSERREKMPDQIEEEQTIGIREYEKCEGVMCKSAATLYIICYFPYLLHPYFHHGITISEL